MLNAPTSKCFRPKVTRPTILLVPYTCENCSNLVGNHIRLAVSRFTFHVSCFTFHEPNPKTVLEVSPVAQVHNTWSARSMVG